MQRLLTTLILLASVGQAVEDGASSRKKSSFEGITKLLPDGSELQGVILPQYDENRRLSAMLKAKSMRLVDTDTMSGNTIFIEFYNEDRTKNGRAELAEALFHSDRSLIEAWSPVSIDSDSIHARGSGLVYALDQGEGVLLGPLQTWASTKNNETAMNSKSKSLRAAGLAGAALIAQSVAAAEVPAVAPSDAPPPVSTEAAKKDMAAALEQSNAANAKAKAFLEQNGLAENVAVKPPEEPAAKPLEVKAGPEDMQIDCDGGMHFNSKEGVFVYMKNVRVDDPRFKMTGANELKIFLEKLPEEEKKDEKKDEKNKGDLGIGKKFGKVERVLATGAIQIDQKSVNGKEPIKASGAIFNYNIKEDLVTVSGGYPWVVQGGIALRAEEPNLMLTILPKAGEFRTEGKWKTILPMKELQKKNEEKKEAKPAQ